MMNPKGPVVIFVVLIGLLVAVGCQSTGPTSEKVPLHLNDISPPDGATVSETHSVCLSFLLQEGNGVDYRRKEWMRLYLDGRNVTDEIEGLMTLDAPPSLGRFCYGVERTLSPGWHTAKVVYWDVKGVRSSIVGDSRWASKNRVLSSLHATNWEGHYEDPLETDLDLDVYDPDGQRVGNGISASNDNNYELVDFVTAKTGQYAIGVYKKSGVTELNNHLGLAWVKVVPQVYVPLLLSD